jgi:hypothetical protein
MVKRDIAWMNKAAHRTVDFDKAGKQTNNHHYWRGLAAVAVGVVSSDDSLFQWGIGVYKQGINEIDQRGAFPQEMARHERAIHYQSFALQPLAPLASFVERQHVPLYEYRSPTGRTIRDAVNFLGAAVANPAIVKPYASEDQLIDADASDFFSFAEFYSHYVASQDIPASILKGRLHARIGQILALKGRDFRRAVDHPRCDVASAAEGIFVPAAASGSVVAQALALSSIHFIYEN